MKHKKGLIIFTTLFSVAVFLSIFLMMWFWGDEYEDFDASTFREEITIPGLKDGACPQGLATVKHKLYGKDGEPVYVPDADGEPSNQVKEQEYYFVSAYFKDKPSRIYVTGKESGYLGYVSLTYHGEPFYGHVGGIATNGTVFWVGSESTVYCLKRTNNDYDHMADEIIKLSLTNSKLELDPNPEVKTTFEINGNASFLSYYKASSSTGTSDTYLYVGEFYRPGNYETPESHHITLPDGSVNRAFMYEYHVASSTDYGLSVVSISESDKANYSATVPKVYYIYSIPDKIQGMARVSGSKDSDKGDTLVLSQSYGLPNSEILLYNFKTISETANRVNYTTIDSRGFEYPDLMYGKNVNGDWLRHYYDTSVYVYYVYGNGSSKSVDSNGNKIYPSFMKSYSIPCMAEGLAVSSDDRVNILFESSAKKYKAFVRQSLDKIYSFRPSRSGI